MANKAQTSEPATPYAQLKARAKELGINPVGVKGEELAKLIADEEARIAADAPTGDAAMADAQGAGNADETASSADDDGDQADEPKSAARHKAIPIARQNVNTWWCPIDDFAMPQYMPGCNKCGAKRKGDTVIPA